MPPEIHGTRLGAHTRRTAARSVTSVAVMLLATMLIGGCQGLPVPTHVGTRTLEKDVIVRDVEIEEQVSPASYKAWAEHDRHELGPQPRHPRFDVPLYEVIYSFRQGAHVLATVIYRREDGDYQDDDQVAA